MTSPSVTRTSSEPTPVPSSTADQNIGPQRLRLPQLHGSFSIVAASAAGDFAAADVHRPPLEVVTPTLSAGNRLLVPAALALLVLVAASGSFLRLAYRIPPPETGVP